MLNPTSENKKIFMGSSSGQFKASGFCQDNLLYLNEKAYATIPVFENFINTKNFMSVCTG